MVYTAVYQQQTGHAVPKISSTVDVDWLSWGEIVWWLALAIQSHLAPRLRKDYSYTSTPFLRKYGLFYFEPYFLPSRRVRRSLLQYIM